MQQRQRYYLVYITTNKVTSTYYIGCHQTYDLADGYLGSGVRLKHAINKYGVDKFKRRILRKCRSAEEMFAYEKKIITKHLGRKLCMNLAEGGKGGWGHVNSNTDLVSIATDRLHRVRGKAHEVFKKKLEEDELFARRHRALLKLAGVKGNKISCDRRRGKPGKPHTDESKAKIGLASSILNSGVNHPQYGRSWISHDEQCVTTRVNRDKVSMYLEQGWRAGRCMKYQHVKIEDGTG